MKRMISSICALTMLVGVLSAGGITVSASSKRGDLNFDDKIDMRDAFVLYIATSGGAPLTEEQAALADLNNDDAIDMRDAFALYRVASGADTLPEEDDTDPDDPYYTDPIPGDNVQDGDWNP